MKVLLGGEYISRHSISLAKNRFIQRSIIPGCHREIYCLLYSFIDVFLFVVSPMRLW
jgi:hypothetical protein